VRRTNKNLNEEVEAMKWLKRIVLALVLIVVAFVGIGFILPSAFRVERSVTIAAPADKVYRLISAPAQWKSWTVWNQRDPAMQITYGGPAEGAGAKWSWQSKTEGNGEMEFTAVEPDRSLTYRLSFPEFGMQSTGQLVITPQDGGVRVSWSNQGDMGSNPMNRWFGLFMDSLVGPDFQAGLANLKQLAEKG
jgi:uncharacterized protein YndB with AHSA1/START domain